MLFSDRSRTHYEKMLAHEVICQLRFPTILSINQADPAEFQDRIRAVLPQYVKREEHPAPKPGQNAETLGLTGKETFDIDLSDLEPGCTVRVTAYRDGQKLEFDTICRVDVPAEVDYIANGGILQYVLRRMAE